DVWEKQERGDDDDLQFDDSQFR
ncbi:hypothetical protein HaLaN_08035, partial [Haematococcus lacustris]